MRLNYRQKMWFKVGYQQNGLIIFGQKNSFYVDSFPSFLPGTLAQALCIYILFHRDISLPAMKIVATLATLAPTVSWLRQVILTQLCRNRYIKLNSSGFLCQFEEKAKLNKPYGYSLCVQPDTLQPKVSLTGHLWSSL